MKLLTGKIEYDAPNGNFKLFWGLFKYLCYLIIFWYYYKSIIQLKKDPKAEYLDNQNLILRGSILK